MGRVGVGLLFAASAATAGWTAAGAWHEAVRAGSLRPSTVAGYLTLKVVVIALFMLFVLLRRPPRRVARDPVAFVACAAAIGCIVALRPPGDAAPTGLVLAGDLIALASWAWLVAATFALGRCFGVLPEARGLVTTGPYAVVRHPLYLGELAAAAGLVIASPAVWNFTLAAVFAAAQAIRMRLEENELTTVFPEYASYAARTPRLIPRVRRERDAPLAPEAGW